VPTIRAEVLATGFAQTGFAQATEEARSSLALASDEIVLAWINPRHSSMKKMRDLLGSCPNAKGKFAVAATFSDLVVTDRRAIGLTQQLPDARVVKDSVLVAPLSPGYWVEFPLKEIRYWAWRSGSPQSLVNLGVSATLSFVLSPTANRRGAVSENQTNRVVSTFYDRVVRLDGSQYR
jgi:hypothetical protein